VTGRTTQYQTAEAVEHLHAESAFRARLAVLQGNWPTSAGAMNDEYA
jgi:hypothetical protein